jgi:acyl transferase domain-containing protein
MVTLLALKGPSHCPMLNSAALRFSSELKGETPAAPRKTVYSNALGRRIPKTRMSARCFVRSFAARTLARHR